MGKTVQPVNWNIMPLDRGSAEGTVRLHMHAFPESFLTMLGPRFLAEFYGSFLMDPTGIALVASAEDGDVIAAAVGPTDPAGFFSKLLMRRWWAFSAASLEAILKKPIIVPRLARAVAYRGAAPAGPKRALLSSVAVAPSFEGQGLGRRLVRAWLAEAKSRRISGCFLLTDADHNERVNRFYASIGFKVESTIRTPEGRRMHRYIYDFERDGEL